ncbi:MAG: anti-sigma factor [Pyrinomonadaceae bacterium]
MRDEKENLVNCTVFEESLTDYLDKTLDSAVHKAVAAHALSCPLCHALLNEVKASLEVCHSLAEPAMPMTRLEARIIESTMPQSALACEEFEEYLTDYLDGFLPAAVFHRWERHAVLCNDCTDLPGAVVRSLAACVSYKLDELPVPAGLHERILRETIGTEQAKAVKASVFAQFGEWVRGLQFPISVPQFAPVAMLMMFAFLVFSQTVSADGSMTDVYSRSYALAEKTYQEGVNVLNEATGEDKTPSSKNQEPIQGTYVDQKN